MNGVTGSIVRTVLVLVTSNDEVNSVVSVGFSRFVVPFKTYELKPSWQTVKHVDCSSRSCGNPTSKNCKICISRHYLFTFQREHARCLPLSPNALGEGLSALIKARSGPLLIT